VKTYPRGAIEVEGSRVVLRPVNDAAKTWIRGKCGRDGAAVLGDTIATERGFALEILDEFREDGGEFIG
jgi:hypothetical protein